VTPADLRAQFDHGMKLRDMQSSTNRALRALDSIRDQIQQIEKAVKDRLSDPPKELTTLLADHGKQAESLQNRLASPQEGLGYRGRSQLAEKIGGLFFSIDGVHAAPTSALTDFFAEVQIEFRERMAEVNRFLEQTVPALNESLRRHDAPTILAGKKIE